MKYKEGKIIYKKEVLKSLIEEKKVRSCTIIGRPTQELIERFLDVSYDMNDLYRKYNLIHIADENGIPSIIYDTTASAYIPYWQDKYITEFCSIVIKNPTVEDIEQVGNLFTHIEEYYQVDVPPSIISKMIGIYSEPVAFSDILYLLPVGRQSDLAELIGKSKQLVSDIKTGKSKMTLDVLKVLMKEYPLLPWSYFIEG